MYVRALKLEEAVLGHKNKLLCKKTKLKNIENYLSLKFGNYDKLKIDKSNNISWKVTEMFFLKLIYILLDYLAYWLISDIFYLATMEAELYGNRITMTGQQIQSL